MQRFLKDAFAAGIFALSASVAGGTNLVGNGTFWAASSILPDGWAAYPRLANPLWVPHTGPNGSDAIRFSHRGGFSSGVRSIRQGGFGLVADGRYRLSADVRTEDFQGAFNILVINYGRKAAVGIREKRLLSSEPWRRLSAELTAPETEGGWTLCIEAAGFSGDVDFANIALEPLDELAINGSTPTRAGRPPSEPLLVPWTPLLHRIPSDTRRVSFDLVGSAGCGNLAEWDLVLSPEGAADVTVTARRGVNAFTLPPEAERGSLRLRMVHRTSGSNAFDRVFTYGIVPPAPAPEPGSRRLNELVTEVVRGRFDGRTRTQEIGFSVPREGWVFVKVRPAAADGAPVATLDGAAVIGPGDPGFETRRYVSAGHHMLALSGARGVFSVRMIPEILENCPSANSRIRENGLYDWGFKERHSLRAITTLNAGKIEPEMQDTLRRSGYRWMANMTTSDITNAETLVSRLLESRGIRLPCHAGVTCDEQNFARFDRTAAFAEGLRRFDLATGPDSGKVVNSWGIGIPTGSYPELDYLSAVMNGSRGRGKLQVEVYPRTMETEEEMRFELEVRYRRTMSVLRAEHPEATNGVGIVVGAYNQTMVMSCWHHPGVDMKYVADLQFHLMANDPLFRDMPLTGLWGSHYMDREQQRWCMRLLRHYLIEGRRDMLSERYGYRYAPGHLADGDFKRGLSCWTVSGDVRPHRIPKLAEIVQKRGGGAENPGNGDTLAVLTRGAGAPDVVSQVVKGLVPGEWYCLQFCVLDVDDCERKRFNPRRYGVDVRLGPGAEVVPGQSWVHVDDRAGEAFGDRTCTGRVNFHHVVFKATAGSVKVSIGNAAAKAGERLGVNFVSLNPYYREEGPE